MPRAITIECPDCDKQVKAPADILGKKIRCKACGAAFTAREVEDADEVEEVEEAPRKKPAAKKPAPKPAPKPEPAKKPSNDDEAEDDGKAYGLGDHVEGHRCPDCAQEMVDEEAIICVYCGYNTVTRERSRTKKTIETTGGDVFWWLLPGILSALGAILLITWICIHWFALESWLGGPKNEEWYMFITHLSMKLWFTVPELFLLYSAIHFAIMRLAIHYQPPELEKKEK